MTIDEAARRAADAIGYDFLENPKPAQIETIKQMITEAIDDNFDRIVACVNAMLLLYDDRAIAVEKNTGRTAGFRQILEETNAN